MQWHKAGLESRTFFSHSPHLWNDEVPAEDIAHTMGKAHETGKTLLHWYGLIYKAMQQARMAGHTTNWVHQDLHTSMAHWRRRVTHQSSASLTWHLTGWHSMAHRWSLANTLAEQTKWGEQSCKPAGSSRPNKHREPWVTSLIVYGGTSGRDSCITQGSWAATLISDF